MQLTPARAARKPAPALAPRTASRSRRSQFLKWLRKVHGWVGLWGAVLGLLFGVTGFLQNHRATMKIKVGEPPQVTTAQLPVASGALTSPRDLAQFVRKGLKLDRPASASSKQAAQAVAWGDQSLIQPERWTVRFIAPNYLVNAEYWKGGTFVSVERRDVGVVAVLEAMHRANGTSIGWILLSDSIAGSLILLSITGVILWSELNRKRLLGLGIFTASIVATILFTMQSL